MRYYDLFEAPIGDLEVHGMDKSGTFPDADRKLLTNPEHIEKIRKHFEKTPFIFNFYFHNLHDRRYVSDPADMTSNPVFTSHFIADVNRLAGLRTSKFIHAKLGININNDPSAITVLYLSNANTVDSIPMTPWIIAHRFAHGITDGWKNSNFPLKMMKLMQKLLDIPAIVVPGYGYIRQFMTTRSARTGTLKGDWTEEMIAQYLMTGQFHLRRESGVDSQKIADINATIKQLLTACVGHIFVTI